MKLEFILHGAPRTKKNSNRLVSPWRSRRKRQYVLPSEAWEKWRDTVVFYPSNLAAVKAIKEPVNCQAVFYRDALRGDAVGYYQGLADLLEYFKIVDDDKWIVSWNGSRLDKDAKKPRVEVTLESIN